MASTYSTNLKLQLMTTGENLSTWGTVTNTNLGTTLEEAICGSASITFSDDDVSITLSNSNASQDARHMRLNLTGSTGGTPRTLTIPDIEKAYIVNNACSDTITVANSTGSDVAVPAGKSMWVYSTGAGVVSTVTHLSTLSVGTSPSNVVTENATQTLTNKTTTTEAVSDNSTKLATTAFVQATITDRYPEAGSGIDITGKVVSVEPDLRDGITHVGLDSGDYIAWVNNTHTSMFVNGAERVRVEADGDLHADGDVIAYSNTISDERLKTNIAKISAALNKVAQLRGVTFTRHNGQDSAGLIAQEVERVLPEAVKETALPLVTGDEDTLYKVVEYDAVVGLLVQAINELADAAEADRKVLQQLQNTLK